MSEEVKAKAPRTINQVQQEYQALCQRAGYIGYLIYTNEKDLAMVNESLRNLNLEANSIQAAEAAEKAKAAEEAAKVSSEVKGESNA